jgi:hypothetical protein
MESIKNVLDETAIMVSEHGLKLDVIGENLFNT